MAKNKYLIFREQPYNEGITVAHVDVNHLNKKGIYAEWDRLNAIFPPERYHSCLVTTSDTFATFIDLPKNTENAQNS